MNSPKSDTSDMTDATGQSKEQFSFAHLSLSDDVQKAIATAGYKVPSPIQAAVIPHLLDGRDLIGQAQTGTGKTAAFALPLLSQIDCKNRNVQVLVLAPTRELAMQVADSFSKYADNVDRFSVAAIYGGQDYEPQLRQLRRGVQVVVGTPGRVIDHIRRGTLDVSAIQCLVLDEADEMLNMGFLDDVEFVLAKTPSETQIALFSATLPDPIRRIAEKYLKNPEMIRIKQKTVTAANVRQRCLFAPPREKIGLLIRLLEAELTDGVIVFAKTKDSTVSLAEKLSKHGYAASALNGDMPQSVRERTVSKLKKGQLDILVATDVAARGLDVSRVSHVINFDPPHDSESYVHRIGRTGRAGRSGEAIILLTRNQRGRLRQIERVTRQPIEIVDPPTIEAINKMRVDRYKEKITETISKRDTTFFRELIEQFTEEMGLPIEDVAAALADMACGGRPLLMKEPPKQSRRRENFDDDRSNRLKGGRGDRDARGGKRRFSGPVQDGMARFRVEVGRVDGVKPGNLVGAIANEAGINGEFIGPIQISHGHTTIDLPADMPEDILQTLRKTWVAGKRLNLSRDNGQDERGGKGKSRRYGGKKKYRQDREGKYGAEAKGKFARQGKKKGKKKFAKPAAK